MRCLPCGAEMDLMHVVQDKTISVPGYEHRTFKCSACGDIERRLVFAKDSKKSYAEPMLVYTAPHISAAPTGHKERISGSGILRRIFGILRVLCQSSRSSEPVLVRPATPTSLRPAEPAPAPTITPLVPSEASNDLDGLDTLLKRDAGLTHRPQPTEIPVDARAGTSAEIASSASLYSLPTSVLSGSEKELDECDALLRRTIEMVRAPMRSSQVTTSITKSSSGAPPKLVSPVPAERRPASRVFVQILHDPQKGKYVAKDTSSGLRILRHEDTTRLRSMCDRMGWQVIEDRIESP
jgi:hypothetical protein